MDLAIISGLLVFFIDIIAIVVFLFRHKNDSPASAPTDIEKSEPASAPKTSVLADLNDDIILTKHTIVNKL